MMKKEIIKRTASVVFVGVLALSLLSFAGIIDLQKLTGFAIFEQNDGTGFDEGMYSNVLWDGSSIVLSGDNLTGNYTSKIFDAGNDAIWNSLIPSSLIPSLEVLFAVDGGGDVYQSTNLGIDWTQLVDNYGRTTATAKMFADNSYLYILSTKGNEVWRSSNGTDFQMIYSGFDGRSPLLGKPDNSGNVFVITTPGEVWKSTNYGVNWTIVGDFNPGTRTSKGMAIDSDNYMYAVDRTGTVYKSVNLGADWVEINSGYGGSTATDGMVVDSNDYLYILLNEEIFKSINSGVDWTSINDSFTPYANVPVEIGIDESDNIYIIDAVGRVFKSSDLGLSWNEIGDCNNDATNDPMGMTNFIQQTNLTYYVRSCDDALCSGESWTEITDPSSLGLSNKRYFQYNVEFTSPATSISPSLTSMNIDYDLLNTAPTINLIEPQNGATYGYNESLSLNFNAIDADDNIEACWYTLNGAAEIILSSCANTTIDVPEESNTLIIYINDSLGLESNDSATFNVAVGAPTIILNSPIDSYSNSNDVTFSYTPTDIDLESCELWGDFDGIFQLNQTDASPSSGSENTFSLTLEDGEYLWNIKCNDSVGNSAFNGNKTFYIDTTNPSLSLSEPSGAKTTRTGIPLAFVVTDSSPLSCSYNITTSVGTAVVNNVEVADCSNTDFAVSSDGDYILYLFTEDSAGNSNSTNSSFSVSSSTPPTPPVGNGGSSGGSGGSATYIPATGLNVEITPIEAVIYPGEEKSLEAEINNKAIRALNKCSLKASGGEDSWFSSTDIKNIGAGEIVEFKFTLTLPSGAQAPEINLVCLEGEKTIPLKIILVKPSLNLVFSEITLTEEKGIKIIYSIKADADSIQNLIFSIYSEGKKVKEVTQEIVLSGGEESVQEIIIELGEMAPGLLKISVSKEGEEFPLLEDSILYDSNLVFTGLVLGGLNGGEILIIFIVIIFLIFAGIIVWRIIKNQKK